MSDFAFRNHKQLPIAIVGGGLGGLGLAIGLLKHDIKVHIYEASPTFSEIGAGITFGNNATTALQLLDPRLLQGFMKHATFNTNPERSNTFNTVRWGMDEKKQHGHKAGDFAFHQNDKRCPDDPLDGLRMRGRIHRARLMDEMIALIPTGTTSFKKSFESIQELDDGILKLTFTDGSTALASAVVGCDGIRSKVRNHICSPEIQAKYAGECAVRAMVPGDEAIETLGKEMALNSQLYCGYGGYVVTYPVEHGRFINMVAMPQDEASNSTRDCNEWTVPTNADEIRGKFKDWYPPLIDLIARHHLPTKWALFVLQHDAPYFKHHICLLGDSAHATTPHMGAGAGMAMEDAYILSNLIAAVGSTEDIESAFRAYDTVRRPRTQGCIKRSMDAALAYDFMMEGVGDDMVKIEERLDDSFAWLWHEDLERQLQRAKELLQAR
ncbi:mannitol 1-phosphate dehydrogenase [Pyrenophora seminiperda CCB06]|uniref:Mannitol 1-phosphate dehydrogenase n=1 Tax=Pyrenophora seminiperda CCB06 TaxID=1302712 RepID=A0A3M7MB47_9PLEO|nr:mannitol 1-phosphate dehydrogenase [Pyrenophora seminiperda CCB06]